MPATYTHYTFSKDVYKVIKPLVQEKIDFNIFSLFNQSFDLLYFSKYKLGIYAHQHFVNLYFQNIIYFIRDKHLENNKEVLSYLYGSICHYILDSTIHPYVYYYTGVYKDKSTKKYIGKHAYFEFMLDAIIYQERNHKNIARANIRKEIFQKYNFNKDLNDIIDYTFVNTFQFKNAHSYIKRGIKNYSFVLRHGFMSRLGIKYYLYRLLDFRPFKKMVLHYNCYYIRKLDYRVLNKEHNKWYYPVDKEIHFHYSFYDLYDVAIERARALIEHIDSAIDKDEKDIKKVLREIGNLGYDTGKNVNKSYVMKYFKY